MASRSAFRNGVYRAATPRGVSCALSLWMVLLQFPLPMLHSHEIVGVADQSLLVHLQRHHARQLDPHVTAEDMSKSLASHRHLHFVMPWEFGTDPESHEDSRQPEQPQPWGAFEGRIAQAAISHHASWCLRSVSTKAASCCALGHVCNGLILCRAARYADSLSPATSSLITRLGVRRC